jgi:dienelactone hydrolase/catechol 2,3-dioxygenase-like lactoylglutathione lyase family enzyme
MRFPSQAGCIAGVSINVSDLGRAAPFWHAVLHPLGYGRIGTWPNLKMWARDGAQVLLWQAPAPAAGMRVLFRAPDREAVDRLHERAVAEGWPVIEPAAERPFAPGYYSCILADPDGIRIELVHAFADLPEQDGAERVRIAGADGATLGGYLFTPAANSTPASERQSPPGVIVLHGYGLDATQLVGAGCDLAKSGFAALCLSSRGWLGSTGEEDQGFRQPDDVIAAARWLRAHARSVGLIGFSQGGQIALLAAARSGAPPFSAAVAYFAPTDLLAWKNETAQSGIPEYLEDFVPAEHMAACSPVTVADRIRCPVLLLNGDQDTNVPLAQARAMVDANPAIELRVIEGAAHGWPREKWNDVWPEAVAFLARHG